VTVSKPEIHAVVEVAIRPEGIWVQLPPQPWPDFVRLWQSTTPLEVALLVGVMSSYGRTDGTAASSPEAVIKNFPNVLPGGLAVISSKRKIMPSCCCGLETWPDWKKVVSEGQSPWTGHDPAPLIEVVDDTVRIWSDGGMGEKPTGETPIAFDRRDFVHALEAVSNDLKAFLIPLRSWLHEHAPRQATKLVERFSRRFVDR
jgi:hypothetical protein